MNDGIEVFFIFCFLISYLRGVRASCSVFNGVGSQTNLG